MANHQVNHITDLATIREQGILLTGRGTHIVRVRGALREVPAPPPSSNPGQGEGETNQDNV